MSEVKVNKISPRIDCGTVTVGDAGDSVTVTAGVPVTVNGDLKSNALKAVDGGSIISQCGTTITLGASGDTINLAAGASQTGFGRTGTVNWDTTAKTAAFTAVSGNGYFVNTTSGAITVTMPATPSAGDIVGIKDYAGTFATNNVTVGRNGSLIDGAATDATLSTKQLSVFFVYVDGTQGWKATQSDAGNYGAAFITATGGTVTCCGDYKIHTFTGPGTFCVSCAGNAAGSNTVSYLVVAGGGGAGEGYPSSNGGGGGGAGGFRESKASSDCYSASPLNATSGPTYNLPVSATGYPITVGAGGTGAGGGQRASGAASTFSTITSAGGGGAGNSGPSQPNVPALTGGSGGGGAGGTSVPGSFGCGAAGNTPPTSPPQGNPGGSNQVLGSGGGTDNPAGGGGGATAPGQDGQLPLTGGAGGAGATTSITGSPVAYSGGGGGGGNPDGAGGTGGGGSGGSNGTANTGGGGGGNFGTAGTGGSGIVVIRYKFQ